METVAGTTTEKGEGEAPFSVKKAPEDSFLRTTRWEAGKRRTEDGFVVREVAVGDGFVERNGFVGSRGVREKELMLLGGCGRVIQLDAEEGKERLLDERMDGKPLRRHLPRVAQETDGAG